MTNLENKKRLVTLEFFTGFYESIHSSNFDREEESIIEENGGDCDDYNFTYDWNYYCQGYVNAVNSILDLGLEFESLQSPKYYNFTTDRIFCYMNDKDLTKIYEVASNPLHAPIFENYIKESFTSRDGFCSCYPNDPNEWRLKPTADYDHNELGALLEVFALIKGAQEKYVDYCGEGETDIDGQAAEYCGSNGYAGVTFTKNPSE